MPALNESVTNDPGKFTCHQYPHFFSLLTFASDTFFALFRYGSSSENINPLSLPNDPGLSERCVFAILSRWPSGVMITILLSSSHLLSFSLATRQALPVLFLNTFLSARMHFSPRRIISNTGVAQRS